MAASVPPNNSQILTNSSCDLSDGSLRIPLAIFYSLFFVLGSIGNLLALWVFLWLHPKKNSVRVFLINVALADLMLIICLPFRIFYHANGEHWNLPLVICKMVGTLFYMNMYVSIILLGLISIDRYLKLQRISNQRRFLNTRRSVLTCGILWLVFICGMIPYVGDSSEDQSGKCFQYKQLKDIKWKAYINFILVVFFWVIYGVLMMSYGKIAMGLLHISKEKPDLPHAAKYSRTARKSFFVLFLFTVCFVPYHTERIFYIVSQITDVSCRWLQVIDKTNELALLLSAFNSCLDPVMYFVMCGSVRRTLLQMLNRCTRIKASDCLNVETRRNNMEASTLSESSTLQRKTRSSSTTPLQKRVSI